jgi:hypothetical protein
MLWPYILVILLICGYVYRIWFTFVVESQLVHHNVLTLDILDSSTGYVSCILIIIYHTINHLKNLSLILKKFVFLNGYFFGCLHEFNTQKGMSPVITAFFWLLVCIRIIITCSNLVVWNSQFSLGTLFGGHWCRISLCVVILKYVLLVQYYRNKHKVLNQQVIALNDLTPPKFKIVLSKNMNDLLTVGSRSNPRPNQTPDTTACTTIPHRDTVLLNRVKALQDYHMHLYDVAQLLNSAYGFQMLLCLGFLFTELIYDYNMAIDIVVKMVGRYVGIATDFQEWNAVCAGLFWSVILTFVTVSCGLASEEANRTGHLVHTFLAKPDLSRDLILQLHLFASQVSNLQVKFTTCGIFTINASLICGIGGVVCTYLIIFHQFR